MPPTSSRLEKILLDSQLITAEQLGEAKAAENGKSVFQVLDELGYVTEEDIAKTVAETLRLDLIDLGTADVDPNAANAIDETVSQRYKLIAISIDDDEVVVAMSDPANIFAIDDLRIITGRQVKPVVATESDVLAAIKKYCRGETDVAEMMDSVTDNMETEVGEADEDEESQDKAPIVKLVNLILTEGVRNGVSDILVEPQDQDLRTRLRIDGVLHEMMRSPKKVQGGVLSRLKLMAGMDIAEKRVPQDGRFGIIVDGEACDFRVATLPTIYGEQVILRLLRKESALMNLSDMGFLDDSMERLKTSYTKPYGAILVTGPTGSGKTTTLYATLNTLNTIEKNLITVEDPVEYRLEGMNQVQVNTKAKLTFAAALRSILRQDPDIIMIGEIRDKETATIAIESALTGHLVLSTLHTNDSGSSLTRLVEMGIEPFLVASAVDCVVAQRLARRLCSNCMEAYKPTQKALDDIDFPVPAAEVNEVFRARGCKKCHDTGYKGRVGLYEVLTVSEEIERLIVSGGTAEDVNQMAISEGMRTLRQDGFLKVLKGLTSIEEIMRVTV